MDELFEQGADWFEQADDITIISHCDADGLCATAILADLCKETGKKYRTKFLLQISSLALERLAKECTDSVVIVDMGSTHLDALASIFAGKELLVLDHHQMNGSTEGATVINPNLAKLDGTRDISAAGIAFCVADKLVDATPMAPVALIGAQADNQEPFEGYNADILDRCVEAGLVETHEGARLFGIHSKPLPQLIAFSYDLKIPGLTKDLRKAQHFLRNLGIDYNVKRYYGQLNPKEQEQLDESLIAASPNPDARITHYTIVHAPRGPLRDTREAATLLNACGRVGKPEIAVKVLLGDEDAVRDARGAHKEYRFAIKEAYNWFTGSPESAIHRQGDLLLIDGHDAIPAFVVGTLCSILVRGHEVPDEAVVVCLARVGDGTTKVSGRTNSDFDLAAMFGRIAPKFKGEGGGHSNAAGALIPESAEDDFIAAVEAEF